MDTLLVPFIFAYFALVLSSRIDQSIRFYSVRENEKNEEMFAFNFHLRLNLTCLDKPAHFTIYSLRSVLFLSCLALSTSYLQ